MTIGTEHLHARRRLFRNLAPYPHPDAVRRRLDSVMLVVGPLAPLALLPQVLEIYQTQDASAFSLLTWCALATINSLWTMYGFLHRETAILLANGGIVLLNIAIIVGILMY